MKRNIDVAIVTIAKEEAERQLNELAKSEKMVEWLKNRFPNYVIGGPLPENCILLPEDELLYNELKAVGIDSEVIPWNQPGFNWSTPKLCIIRSAWDWHKYPI